MIRRLKRPFKRMSLMFKRRMRFGNWFDVISKDGREILEYSKIEGFNHLVNKKLHYIERYITITTNNQNIIINHNKNI